VNKNFTVSLMEQMGELESALSSVEDLAGSFTLAQAGAIVMGMVTDAGQLQMLERQFARQPAAVSGSYNPYTGEHNRSYETQNTGTEETKISGAKKSTPYERARQLRQQSEAIYRI